MMMVMAVIMSLVCELNFMLNVERGKQRRKPDLEMRRVMQWTNFPSRKHSPSP